jgi:hypothetical protein
LERVVSFGLLTVAYEAVVLCYIEKMLEV